ncbi:hypothetical protein PoB_003866500 [Plakobranchus ocellatus]|uniref:Uncharacterized protein n=1 Tax=Plakobranchus ocellatus TaxID=259542 RepID=A0AAV4AUZ6_9GAST|nr:hypothetical protein PoB_003866500 [Plakobranchus ocellatus]
MEICSYNISHSKPTSQLTPSRPAPKCRISETFSPDIALPKSSDPPAEPATVMLMVLPHGQYLRTAMATAHFVEKFNQLFNCFNSKALHSKKTQSRLLENLFSVIRGKGGHRFNPSPQEFRAALRQTMVDAVRVQSKSQNYRGDIDAFLFSLDQVPSLGANAAGN